MRIALASLIFALACGVVVGAEQADTSLPEGGKGIAAAYPGDKGIEKDTDVIFVEKFDEESIEAVARRGRKRNRPLSPNSRGACPGGSVSRT